MIPLVKIYADKRIQLALCIIYPIAVYFFLTEWNGSTWQPIAAGLVFCALWENIRYVLLSAALTVLIALPLWWNLTAPHVPHLQQSIAAFYPLVTMYFVLFIVLLPCLAVGIRNVVMRFFVRPI